MQPDDQRGHGQRLQWQQQRGELRGQFKVSKVPVLPECGHWVDAAPRTGWSEWTAGVRRPGTVLLLHALLFVVRQFEEQPQPAEDDAVSRGPRSEFASPSRGDGAERNAWNVGHVEAHVEERFVLEQEGVEDNPRTGLAQCEQGECLYWLRGRVGVR